MRKFSLLIFLLCSLVEARADVISGTLSGTIAYPSVTDTYGLFGLAGADLFGDSVVVTYSYDTADFVGPARSCGNCVYYNSTQATTNESVTVTLNGITQSYVANAAGFESGGNSITFDSGNHYFEEQILTSAAPAFDGASLLLETMTPASLGSSIGNFYQYTQDLHLYVGGQAEELQFGLTAVTPEPSSLLLLSTGLLALGAVARRRLLRA